ncbi:hypothetical protein [Desulfatitalea tepidiphila]|uniref:hypothetical protein n=1 Tax=Desulfatitalea tepidiphila TaxID=1185843 RepID=UPI00128F4BAE|nr:hypothetical protein [Desulfatitalea tepidiphila]
MFKAKSMTPLAVFKIATLMHRCGVRKHHGHSVHSLTKAIFTLPFVGKNFLRGIVLNSELPFGKDAAYELLKGETYNLRRLLIALGLRLFGVFNRLPSDERESAFIIDEPVCPFPLQVGGAALACLGSQHRPLLERLSDAHHLLVGQRNSSVPAMNHVAPWPGRRVRRLSGGEMDDLSRSLPPKLA